MFLIIITYSKIDSVEAEGAIIALKQDCTIGELAWEIGK